MTYDDLMSLMKKRRSVRYFADKPVDKAMVEKLLNVAVLAPSVENTQPWVFHVVTNADLKAQLMETSCYGNFVSGASVFIVMTCDRSAKGTAMKQTIWNPRELEYSCVAAMHSVMLAAATMDIGTCWVSLHHGPAHNLLKLKDHMVVVGGLMLGYYKPGETEASGEHERKPIGNAIQFLD